MLQIQDLKKGDFLYLEKNSYKTILKIVDIYEGSLFDVRIKFVVSLDKQMSMFEDDVNFSFIQTGYTAVRKATLSDFESITWSQVDSQEFNFYKNITDNIYLRKDKFYFYTGISNSISIVKIESKENLKVESIFHSYKNASSSFGARIILSHTLFETQDSVKEMFLEITPQNLKDFISQGNIVSSEVLKEFKFSSEEASDIFSGKYPGNSMLGNIPLIFMGIAGAKMVLGKFNNMLLPRNCGAESLDKSSNRG